MSDTQYQYQSSFLTHLFFDRLRCAGWLWVGSWQDWLQGCSKHCFFHAKDVMFELSKDATSSYISERNIGNAILLCWFIHLSLIFHLMPLFEKDACWDALWRCKQLHCTIALLHRIATNDASFYCELQVVQFHMTGWSLFFEKSQK